MGLSQKISSFSCEIKIIQAQNIEPTKPNGNLFARLYLPAGNSNKRIQLNTKKVPSKKSLIPFWDESFNLECSCPQDFLDTLKQESLVLELRQSKKLMGSNLVGRGEVPWKEVLESPNMELNLWVKMGLFDMSGPELLVEIKIQVSSKCENMEKGNSRSLNYKKWDECGCEHGHDHHAWCTSEDYDLFALGAALEAF